MKVVIMAGGSGTRLWPLSRENFPKQFIEIDGENLLTKTYKRFIKVVNPKDIFIITNEKYRFYVVSSLSKQDPSIEERIILEPTPRNTLGALMLSLKYLKEKEKISEDELIFLTPSDHIIKGEEKFLSILEKAKEYSCRSIVTFGIKPTMPHTGYGYIELSTKISDVFYNVRRFTEKPDIETAVKYISTDKYLWNSGMFFFSYRTILSELKKCQKDEYLFFSKTKLDDMIKNFSKIQNISIDYAIMEKTKNIVVAISDISWSDIGGWEAFFEIFNKRDENSNIKLGNIIDINTKNSFIYSNTDKLISTIDVEDLIIINTEDAVLISKKGSSEKVREVVKRLKENGNIKAIEHPTVCRPWGSYTVLEEGERYKIKRIFVKPGHKLSNQMHFHRSEHWVVVKGTARVIMDGKEYLIHENESIYVPKSTKHRLENPGKVDLEVIEVQNGEYLGEDDIIRFEDDYGRTLR